ncbi:MAG TPA: ABC transporter permease, partial [Candidatus Angelobacter sp.]|nr:ABC transporter permease [Candidatus Angelobacter sp.]
SLRKNPGFTILAVVILALGIGANTAIFSIVDTLIFRPLPVSRPGEVVRIFNGETQGDAQSGFSSLPSYEEYRDQSEVFSSIAAYGDRFPANVSVGKFGTERVDAGMVTANYFQVLEVQAELGRTLLAEDDRSGAAPVAMLGHAFWRKYFPSNVNAVGSQILVNGQWFTVVGVTPAGFGGIAFDNFPDVWLPMTQAVRIDPLLKSQIPLRHKSFSPFGIVARLKPGVSMEQAQAQLDTVAKRLGAGKHDAGEGPNWQRPWPVLVPVTEAARQRNTKFSFLLLGIVALVLLIACADVAGLMMSRSESRQREIAVRLALGGSRRRIVMLHLSEALLISGLGAGLGCALAGWATQLIVLTAPRTLSIPLTRTSSVLDIRVLAFTAFVALSSALISAIAPAVKYSRSDLVNGIKSDSGRSIAGNSRFSAQAALVVIQIASSVLLLVGTGLLTRTLWHGSQVRLGFDPQQTVFASTDLVRQGYESNAAANLLTPLLESLRAQPGVQSAALGPAPLDGDQWTTVKLEGHDNGKLEGIGLARISPEYFATVGIPLLKGRDFRRSDTASAPRVAIVSAAMAQKYWPNENPLGKHIEQVGTHDQSFEIVGIVGNTAAYDLRYESTKGFYFPLEQTYLMFPWQPDTTLIAKGPGNSGELIGCIRKAVAGVNAELPIFHARTLKEYVGGILGKEKFLARLLIIFSLVAVVLAAAGVFGLMSYNTERGTHDFGVRMALGAQSHHVLWMVLRKGLMLAIAGLVLGLGAAMWMTRLLVSFLFGVRPNDLLTFSGVAVMTVVIALLACYLPARRATNIDPLEALRNE